MIRKQYKCTVAGCNSSFFYSHHLRRHNREIHEAPLKFMARCFDQTSIQCPRCTDTMNNSTLQCTFGDCSEKFAKKYLLSRHIAAHTGGYSFLCDHPGCERSFKTGQKLRLHQRIHNGLDVDSFNDNSAYSLCRMYFLT